MPRALTIQQGRTEIEWVLAKYGRAMRDHTPSALVSNVLWAVKAGDGGDACDSLIFTYELHRPYNGSHDWFVENEDRLPVIHLDPNFKTPDADKIYPGDIRHPGPVKVGRAYADSEQDGWNGNTISKMNAFSQRMRQRRDSFHAKNKH